MTLRSAALIALAAGLFACESPTAVNVDEVIDEKVEERIQAFKAVLEQRCRDQAVEEAAAALETQTPAGDLGVDRVRVSIDFGATWREARLEAPKNRLAWQNWQARVAFPQTGYYEVWARAVDSAGRSQPMVLPGWNPKGYLNNACHRIAVQVV